MNTAIVSSIIGTVGAGFIAVLVFYLQSLRDDIRAVHARIDKLGSGLGARIGEVESGLGDRIGEVESGLGARIGEVESGLGARIGEVESRLGGIEERLIRIETTQEEHGRLLAGIADHGERIAALEGAVAAMS